MKLILLLLVVGCAALRAGSAPPFTLESALASIARSHPEATAVDEALPPGVVARENLVYAKRGDEVLELDVYRKADTVVRPAVLLVHGGGWVAGSRTMERSFARHLAARGYVAVPVSYRLGPEGRFPGAIHDLKAAVRWLRDHAREFSLHPEKVGILGGSAGATLATFVGATNGRDDYEGPEAAGGSSSQVQAVVNIDGLATFADNALIAQSEGPPSPYYVYQHGTYRTARDTWVEASPLHHVGPGSAPTLFIKSTTLRPLLPGRDEMAARLRILGIDSEVEQFDNTPHVFWLFHPWFERCVETADRFLQRHLQP